MVTGIFFIGGMMLGQKPDFQFLSADCAKCIILFWQNIIKCPKVLSTYRQIENIVVLCALWAKY